MSSSSSVPHAGRSPKNALWALGLMTGTALDGQVDVALLRCDGERVYDWGPAALMPYPDSLRSLLEETLAAARAWGFSGAEPPIFREAERALTEAQAEAVETFLAQHLPGSGITRAQIGVVGFHGQSVLHRAPQGEGTARRLGATRQLGDGVLLQRLLHLPVVFDFRSADVASGGQGAPLAASYHAALLRDHLPEATQRATTPGGAEANITAVGRTAVLNLGGVANLSWWDGAERIIAFDTGPANGPLNDWVACHGLGHFDHDGVLARQGRVDEARLAQLLQHPYLVQAFPKSLDRFDFSAEMAAGLSPADGAALLSAFTASAVGRGLDHLPQRPCRLIVCGGGRRNPFLMELLHTRAGVTALPAEAVGWRGDVIEAECFAYLAVRRLRHLPISFPTTTGVPRPLCGGVLVEARAS